MARPCISSIINHESLTVSGNARKEAVLAFIIIMPTTRSLHMYYTWYIVCPDTNKKNGINISIPKFCVLVVQYNSYTNKK